MVISALVMAWTWAALTPLLFWLARMADPKRIGWVRSLAAHGIMFALVAIGMGMLRLGLILAFSPPMPSEWHFWKELWPRAVFWADVNLFTYLAVVLTGRAVASHRRYLDRTLRTHVLETQLARAQLHFLELQLQPHFLFNSLNAIQELAHEAPNAAERMLRRLHALLSRSLERSGQDEHSLAEELAALEPYIDIQKTRFEWLAVGVHVNPDTRSAMVPHLILQPLVENAIRHGLAVRQGPGHIEVFAERRGDRLVMQVRDDGVGLVDRRRRRAARASASGTPASGCGSCTGRTIASSCVRANTAACWSRSISRSASSRMGRWRRRGPRARGRAR